MTRGGAESTIVTSAIIVGGTYAYLKSQGKTNVELSEFAVAFGAVFMVLAIGATVAPGAAAAFAILVAVADMLANAQALTSTVITAETGAAKASAATPKPTANRAALA
jgi:hypothetical protein